MNTLIKEINYRNHIISIETDDYANSPSEDVNDDMFLIYDHRQFYVKHQDFDCNETFELWREGKMQSKCFPAWTSKDGTVYTSHTEKYHIFAVTALIHSGVWLSLNSSFACDPGGWDTSFKGFALIRQEKGWSWKRDTAYERAELLIEEWNQYLSGEVYRFSCCDKSGYNINSCSGYYGDEGIKEAIAEAKSAIDYHIKTMVEKHVKARKEQIKKKMPINYRKEFVL